MQYFLSLLRLDLSHLRLTQGILGGIAFALPLFVGQITGHLILSILPSLAAFFIYLFLGSIASSYRDKFLSIMIATLGCAVAMGLGSMSSNITWLFIFLTFLVVWSITLLSIYGNIVTAIGQPIIIFWLISNHFAGNLEMATERFWLILLSGIWGMILSLTAWFLNPYRPVKQALITSYRSLTNFLETIIQAEIADDDGQWDVVTSQAQYKTGEAIAQARDLWKQVHKTQLVSQPQSEWFLLLIQEITDLYREMIALTEMIVTLGKMPQFAEIRLDLQETLQAFKRAMKTLDDILQLRDLEDRQKVAKETETTLNTVHLEMEDLTKKLYQWKNSQHPMALHLPQILDSLKNLVGQIDSTINLLLDPGRPVKASLKSVPFTSSTPSFWKTLQSNWTFESIPFNHALRLATVITLTMLLEVSLHWERGYWAALTVLFILKPDYGSTIQTVVQRLIGTVFGAILTTGLVLYVQDIRILLTILIGVAALTIAIRFVNYAFYVILLTMMILVMLYAAVPNGGLLAGTRVFQTLVGGVVAVISYYLWPIWQRRSLPRELTTLLQASLTYFQTVRAAYQGKEQNAKTLDLIRRKAELANANALAAAERMSKEPKRVQADVGATMELIINVSSFINGVTSLRQNLNQFRPSEPISGLDQFLQEVTDTLQNFVEIQQTGAHPLPLPDFTQSLDLVAADYLKTLQESQSKELQGVTFIVAELNHLANKVKGMYRAITQNSAT